jgi:tetratricopeptide (TPR) repeat protein
MRRTLLGAFLLSLVAVVAAVLYTAVTRDQEFGRLITQGDAALASGQTFQAIEAFSGAIALKPGSMIAFLKRGETYQKRGDLGAALRDLRAATRLDPAATKPLELLGDINVTLQRYARAAESYDAYIRLDERSPRILYKLGYAHYRAGNPGAAITALRRAVVLHDRFPEAYYLLGLCLREERRPSEAVAALERASSLSPGLVAPREALVSLYQSLRRDREAINHLEALAALEPDRPERRVAVGLAYARAGLRDTAVVTLSRVAERHPEQPAIYAALGQVWLEAAEERKDRVALRKALEALDTVTSRAFANSEALTLFGRALLLSGDLYGAERALKQASTLYPIEPTAFSNLAVAAERLGHLSIAREALVKHAALAREDEPTLARAVHIADLSLRLNDPMAAVVWFKRALDVSGESVDLLGRLAAAQVRAGNADAARASVARGLALDPRNQLLLSLRARLGAR